LSIREFPTEVCIFTLKVERITDTCIFARLNHSGFQYLAYEMSAALDQEMAMILPLPVELSEPKSQGPVEFLDLSDCPTFFAYLEGSFQPRPGFSFARLFGKDTIEVVEVESFEASYVPSIADFERLDPRFGLDISIWRQLPQYVDHGFAIFKLKPGEKRLHPMALRFRTRYQRQLFFPTVHVHDGTVPKVEAFDHRLFCQSGKHPGGNWARSRYKLGDAIPTEQNIRQLIDNKKEGFRLQMQGEFPNQDVLVPATPLADPG